MHPVIDEMARIPRGDVQVRGEVFGRWLQMLRTDVQPKLDEREALLIEVGQLREQLAAKGKKAAA